jgi:hypothetical protein
MLNFLTSLNLDRFHCIIVFIEQIVILHNFSITWRGEKNSRGTIKHKYSAGFIEYSKLLPLTWPRNLDNNIQEDLY